MKIGINKIYLLFLFSFALIACEKDEDRVILQPGTPPALSVSATTLELTEEQADEEAVTFSWTQADYGFPAAVNYTLQLAEAGTNFAEPRDVELENVREQTYTVAELNTLATRAGLEPDTEGQIEARVRATLAESVEPVFSNTVSIDVTPYTPGGDVEEPALNTIYMIGPATENDWDNNSAMPMFISTTEENTFTYTGFLEEGELKFLQTLGQWAPQWGNDGSGGLQPRPTEDDPDPAPFQVPADGYYTVTVDTLELTYSLEPYDASGATTYSSIGIIGGFNDWADIEPMEESEFSPHIWSIEYTFEEDTALKFRIAEGWETNWGATDTPDRQYGVGVQDGADIEIPAGLYRILFNDLTGRYIFLRQ